MAEKYRVVQWATGVVGKSALKGILRHPKLELVGVKVYSEEKEGLDAGDIIGEGKTGIIASRDIDAVFALEPDCVLYAPLPWDLGEICRLLEAGIHVVTPCPYWFPYIQNPDVAATIGEAQVRNFQKWTVQGQELWPNWYVGQTWQAEVDWMKQ